VNDGGVEGRSRTVEPRGRHCRGAGYDIHGIPIDTDKTHSNRIHIDFSLDDIIHTIPSHSTYLNLYNRHRTPFLIG
jgi:hypothetical protein